MKTLLIALTISTVFTRYYWPQDLAAYAAGGSSHTHIQVDGYVTYKATEADGDVHIRVCDSPSVVGMDVDHCIICEVIPAMPIARPIIHRHVRMQGISRRDSEHLWREVNPLESWQYLP